MSNGKQWTRVKGANLKPQNEEKAKANKGVLESPQFIKACEAISIEPTTRQASKYRRKRGAAYIGRRC